MKTFTEYFMENVDKKLKFYIDMDGVLADFVEHLESVTGDSIENLTKDEQSFKKLKAQLSTTNFFLGLKPMKTLKIIKTIKSLGYEPEILTSVGKFNSVDVANQKKQWLKKHLGFLPKFNYTTSSKDKAKFATPNTVLIDDRTKSTIPFKSAGGKVILHKDYGSTLKQVKRLINADV